MKKSILARGFIGSVASLLGVMAVGCGADTGWEGAAGEGEDIGVSEQALTAVRTVLSLADATEHDGDAITDPVGRYLAASCKVTVGGVEKLLIAGGYSASGAALADVYLYEPAASPGVGTWKQMEPIPNNEARGEAQFIKLDADSCLLVGGMTSLTGGSARVNAYTFNADSTDGSWVAASALNTGRAKFASGFCGNKPMVIGGHDASGTGITTNQVEVFINGAWTSYGQKVTGARDSFGFVSRDSTHHALAGGLVAGAPSNDVFLIDISDVNCDAAGDIRVTQVTDLSTPRFGNVVIMDGADDILVTAGTDDTDNLPTDAEPYDVNWASNPPSVTKGTVLANQIDGYRYPTVVRAGSNTALISGETHAASTAVASYQATPYTKGQSYIPGTGFTVPTTVAPRLGNSAEFLSSISKIYSVAGLTTQGSPNDTMLTVTQELTSP